MSALCTSWEIGSARFHPLHWNDRLQEESPATMNVAGPSSNNAPAVTAQAEDVEPSVAEKQELRSSKHISPLRVPEWIFDAVTEEDEIWKITPEDQMQDPQIRFICESYTASKEHQETWSDMSTCAHSTRTCANLCT
eukprot:2873457-Pleurochrysis_carterae.AAC.2